MRVVYGQGRTRMEQQQGGEDGIGLGKGRFGGIKGHQILFPDPILQHRSTRTCTSKYATAGPSRPLCTEESYPWVKGEVENRTGLYEDIP